jgi:hypothetical protein
MGMGDNIMYIEGKILKKRNITISIQLICRINLICTSENHQTTQNLFKKQYLFE